MQKSIAFLYANNESETESKKKKKLNHIKNKIKYSEINLTKEVKHLYAENQKTLIKKTEDYLKRCKERTHS